MRYLLLLLIISLDSSPKDYYYLDVKCTAYCPCKICCGKYSDGKTATNRSAYTTGVAVDRTVIPLGSRLDIPNYGNWILADDVGRGIIGNSIDIRLQSHQEAINWGVKTIKIRVWRK